MTAQTRIFTGIIMALLLYQSTLGASPLLSANRYYEIPFEYKNHFILVRLTFEKLLPLTFIFDTGAETTLLTSMEIADLLGLTYEREIQIVGADLNRELTAYLARNIHIRMGDLSLPYQSILVLEEDVFFFNEYTGMEVHGVLGANSFRNFIVEIDYENKVIRLMPPNQYRPPRNSFQLPLEIDRNKPYLTTGIRAPNGLVFPVKFLLDSGAGLAVVIHPDTHPGLEVPENVIPGNIGMGLGGNLEGVLGLLPYLQLGETGLQDVPVHYQEVSGFIDSTFLNQRNGILGNKVLERYYVTFDYFRGILYLKPNRRFSKPFPINKSGMTVIATGPDLKTFMVQMVVTGSPSHQAGVVPGDLILSFNRQSFRFFDLDIIYRLLSRKEGKWIRLKLNRDGEKVICRFQLKKMI